jgi:Flp pilus assembly CpaE family ATPase
MPMRWSVPGLRGRQPVVQEVMSDLRFGLLNGPMLAVAGLTGGAGTTTVAYLVAAAAAINSSVPVLLIDLGGPAAGVAAYAPVIGTKSFTAIADHLARGESLTASPFVVGDFGMRLLAAGPELDHSVDQAAAQAVLEQAVAAHGLTVVDCGQLTRDVERVALDLATHIAWVLPASPLGVRRAAMSFTAIRPAITARELVVARAERDTERTVIADLADLADARAAPLVLVPQLADLLESDTEAVVEQAGTSLQAIAAVLRR